MFRKRPTTMSPDDAQSQVDAYQSMAANILMMGTLIFGFVATGTLMSLSFTGEEGWPMTEDDLDAFSFFLINSCAAAISSLLATLISFVFTTRVANQQMHSGPLSALRTVQLTTVFFVFAELLLYFSLGMFMKSVGDFVILQDSGPQICPGEDETVLGNSFCAQAGDEMFQSAKAACSPAQTTPRSRTNPSAPFATCTAYDFYTQHYSDDVQASGDPTTFWFGWDWGDSGYEDGDFGLNETPKQVFFRVINEIADITCGKPSAERALAALCAPATETTAGCAQARTAYLQVDACSGGKQDDAITCRKACQWAYDDYGNYEPWKTALQRRMQFWMGVFNWIIYVVIALRGVAGLVTVVKNLQELVAGGGRSLVWCCDCPGVFDVLHGEGEQGEREDIDEDL